MRKLFIALLCYCCTTFCYANLPYFPLSFPRDEGAHHKNISYAYHQLMEWWYFNGILTTEEGKHFSYDVAIFHPAIKVGEKIHTRPRLDIQIADLDNKKTRGTSKRYDLDTGHFSTKTLQISVDPDVALHQTTVNGKTVYQLHAVGHEAGTDIQLDLLLEPTSPPLLINENGLMPMAFDTNSYYYSIPHFKTTGSITLNGTRHVIANTTGDSWMDHQWGDFNVLQNGWEWFSVRLTNGLVANIFLNIEYKNKKVLNGLANIITPTGEAYFIPYPDFTIARDNYWLDTNINSSFPMTFTFNFPTLGLTFRNVARFPEQELHRYWEGYCDVDGVYQKQAVKGFSYTELVYDQPA